MQKISGMTYPNTIAENATISPKYKNQAEALSKEILNEFFEICKVPRPSGKMRKIRAYLMGWGQKHNIDTTLDSSGCVIMDVPASTGMENMPKILLQSHMDMVAVAEASNKNFDPENTPIKPILDKKNGCIHTGWKTSLGADAGQGMATMLTIAKSKNVKHGPLRLIFTYDEETNMQGIRNLSQEAIDANYLINFDSIYVGMVLSSAAGAFYSTISKQFQTLNASEKSSLFSIHMSGLTGGHSGEDIGKNRGSTIVIASNFLWRLAQENVNFNIHKIKAGTFINAIPAKLDMEIVVGTSNVPIAKNIFDEVTEAARKSYSDGKYLKCSVDVQPAFAAKMLSISDSLKALTLMRKIPNGVLESNEAGTPMISSNIGTIEVEDGMCRLKILYRSIYKDHLHETNMAFKALAKEYDLDYVVEGVFPAWPKMESNPLNNLFLESYEKICGFKGLALDIHSGLECGYLSDAYPDLIMTSIGCDLINEHTRKETLFIKSMPSYVASLLYVLEHIDKLQ